MSTTTNDIKIEPVTLTEILGLNSWDRQRSDDELREFVANREIALANSSETL